MSAFIAKVLLESSAPLSVLENHTSTDDKHVSFQNNTRRHSMFKRKKSSTTVANTHKASDDNGPMKTCVLLFRCKVLYTRQYNVHIVFTLQGLLCFYTHKKIKKPININVRLHSAALTPCFENIIVRLRPPPTPPTHLHPQVTKWWKGGREGKRKG